MWTPRERWMPEQVKQRKMPLGMEAHVGFRAPQSMHVWLFWCDRSCLKIAAVSSALAVASLMPNSLKGDNMNEKTRK